MRTLLVAIHGILTNQTDASWPDKLDAWMFDRDPNIKVLKKEYRAGPFPRWNCYIKDPKIAESLANEIELFLTPGPCRLTPDPCRLPPDLWFVAHSNGAIIALLTARLLVQRGYRIAGIILTGAACQADLSRNGILEMIGRNALGSVIAYSSPDDHVLPGLPQTHAALGLLPSVLYSLAARPYGSLGRTGLLLDGLPLTALDTFELRPHILYTRFFGGGHSTYFARWNIERTFRQILADITTANRAHYDHLPNSYPDYWRN